MKMWGRGVDYPDFDMTILETAFKRETHVDRLN